MTEFLDSLDIANRAMQHCGVPQIASVTEDSRRNKEASLAYGKVRTAELRRNTWRFAVRKACLRPVDTNTMLLVPTTYDATKTYLPGSIVADANGQAWHSMSENNINNTPGGNNEIWDSYFGPLTVQPYDTTGTTTYFAGELVYVPGVYSPISGSYQIYMSLINANADVPNTAAVWSAATTYVGGWVVSFGGFQWVSLIEQNLNNSPAVAPLAWDSGATYSSGQTVTGTDGYVYASAINGNIGNQPAGDSGAHWTISAVQSAWAKTTAPVSSPNWVGVQATMKTLRFSYPITAGPLSQSASLNAYRLPSGYLKEAPQDPKAGSVSFLGASTSRMYDDWNFEGHFIVTRQSTPMIFRFVADVTKVSSMEPLFCEGLGCRLAAAVCAILTQSDGKLQTIASEYKLFMGEARTANFIETGPVEPPTDDWITARI